MNESTTNRDDDDDDADDEKCWEPLDEQDNDNDDTVNHPPAAAARLQQQRATVVPLLGLHRRHHHQRQRPSGDSSRRGSNARAAPSRRQQHENSTNKKRRDGGRRTIMDHPMQRVASHFCVHMCREVWGFDWNLRLALLCLFLGAIFQVIVWCFYFALYPEHLLYLTTILLGAGVPLVLYNKTNLLKALESLQNADELADVVGKSLNSTQLRSFAAAVIFVVPVLLEMRTLHFLSNLVGGAISSTVLLCCYVTIILLGYYYYYMQRKGENKDATQLLLFFDLFRYAPRECTQTGMYLLYGSALCVVLRQGTDWRHVPTLAARFLLATAVLLWKMTDDKADGESSGSCISQAVQNALRMTVRDALQECSNSVQEDEMLQLTMLRWIVDYWSSSASSSSSPSNNTSSAPPTQSSTSTSALVELPQHDLEWTELWGMLQTTTNQMASEVQSLQQQQHQQSSQHLQSQEEQAPDGSTSSDPEASIVSAAAKPSDSTQQQQNTETSGSSSGNHSSASTSGNSQQQFGDSVYDLQTMLATMDIDERAKPAVLAYKRTVESFPPSRRTAIVLAVAQRCPALLLLLFYFVVDAVGLFRASTTVVIILLPFILLEVLRIHLWIQACNEVTGNRSNDGTGYWLFKNVDSMIILLMDESYCVSARLPTLLLVWQNVLASVSALEVGLTAARCVQTTAVAVDFAANIMSLADFGYQVSQHGWLHGLSILAQELLHLHTTGSDFASLSQGRSLPPMGAKYTGAAVNAVRNSRTMSRNVQALMEEEHTSKLVGPLLGFVSLLIGQGWLWGRDVGEEYRPAQSRSTVVIEELDDDDETEGTPADGISDVGCDVIANEFEDESIRRADVVRSEENSILLLKSEIKTSLLESSAQRGFQTTSDHPSDLGVRLMPGSSLTAEAPLDRRTENGCNIGSAHETIGTKSNDEAVSESKTADLDIINPVKQDNANDSSLLFEAEAAEMMDLLAQCVECGLLVAAEKNSIVEKFAEMSRMQDDSTVAWVRGNTLSLRGLLDQSAAISDATPVASDAHSLQKKSVEASRLDALRLTNPSVDFKGGVAFDGDDDSFVTLDGQNSETLVLDATENGALSVSSDESSSADKPIVSRSKAFVKQKQETAIAFHSHPSERDNDFEPLNVANSEDSAAHDKLASATKEEDDDSLWLKVGGGLALVGAVVAGGVALANAHKGGGDKRRRNSRDGGSVTISDRASA